jgi:hypothetical protein
MSPSKQTKNKIEILMAGDALQPQPPVNWIVEGLISAGSVNIFYGEGGSKKTWALLDMGVCVATDAQWLDFKTIKSHVLIIDEESGKRRILRRLGEVLRGHSADQTTPVNVISLAGFDLGQAAWIGELTNQIIVTNSKLVIIDALADVMPGKDENLVKDVQPIFLALRKIAEDTQAAIILIHHANKGKKDYRGSTAIKGAIDLLLQIESDPGKDLIKFESIKARDTEPVSFAACAQFMTLDPKEFWLITTTPPKKNKIYPKSQAYVLCYLLANGISTIDDIKANADPAICSPRTAQNAVGDLMDLALVERSNTGGQGSKAEYQLTPKGQNEAQNL